MHSKPIPKRSTLLRRTPLAACLLALFSLSPGSAAAVDVTTCADSGAGSLRAVIGSAASGDTVNLSALSCSSISLSTGAIHVLQSNLTLNGPTGHELVLDQDPNAFSDRILVHNGNGTLALNHLTVRHGYASSTGGGIILGGCIYSAGSVSLTNTQVTSCRVGVTGGGITNRAEGGGIFAQHGVTLTASQVSFNAAYANPGHAYGGGVFASGFTDLTDTTVSYNTALASDSNGAHGYAGGLFASGGSSILSSTLDHNLANAAGGGMVIPIDTANYITSSTISGNTAGVVGGLLALNGNIYISQSTIAFNNDGAGTFAGKRMAAGFAAYARGAPINLHLISNVMSNNAANGNDFDFSTSNGQNANEVVNYSFDTAYNLIYTSVASVPSDTLIGKCPLLGPLRNNGGPTRTHALLSRSQAIDHGHTTGTYDQRGAPYYRASGAGADIGAYEVQANDVIFNTTFEGCL